MGLLALLALPLSAPMRGTLWLFDKVTEAAEAEYYDEGPVLRALVALEQLLEAGALSEEEYDAAERPLLERLRAIRNRESGRS